MIYEKVKFLSFVVVVICIAAIFDSYAQMGQATATSNNRSISMDSNIKFYSPTSEIEEEESRIRGGFPKIVLDKPVDPEKYMVGVGDQLILITFGKVESDMLITVGPEGKVILPDVGDVSVVGLTLAAVKKKLIKIMKKQYPRLNFQLLLAQPRSFKVYVLGEVIAPGVYILTALNRVSDVIAKARGIKKSGTSRKIEIRRNGKVLYSDLYSYVQEGNLKTNPHLLENDIVFVPLSHSRITIGGGVKRPGVYELEGQEDLKSLIGRIGGLTSRVSNDKPIKVVRFNKDNKKKVLKLNMNMFLIEGSDSFLLKDGDTVFIPSVDEIPSNETNIYISGEVKKPGGYPYYPGYTAKSYVGLAGGLTPRARFSQAEIIKTDGRKIPLGEETVLEIGDTIHVPEKFIKVWQDCLIITTSISSLTLAVIAAFK